VSFFSKIAYRRRTRLLENVAASLDLFIPIFCLGGKGMIKKPNTVMKLEIA
jgi:hypothetical protein